MTKKDDAGPGGLLLTGATGFFGRHLGLSLLERGVPYAALCRPTSDLTPLRRPGVAIHTGDLGDAGSLRRALEGRRAVVHLAGAADVSDPEENRRANVEGVRNLLEACRGAGVRRVVHFSSTCAGREKRDAYGETKLEGEKIVLAARDLEVTVFRPTMIYGEWSKEFLTFAGVVRRSPLTPILGTGKRVIRPVFVDDVVSLVLAALAEPRSVGKLYDVAGPEPISFDDFSRLVARLLGVKRPIVHVPIAPALLGARLLGRLFEHPVINVDQVLAFDQDTAADISPAAEDLSFDPRPPEEGLRILFGRMGWLVRNSQSRSISAERNMT